MAPAKKCGSDRLLLPYDQTHGNTVATLYEMQAYWIGLVEMNTP